MGIRAGSLEFIHDAMDKVNKNYSKIVMCELGNQVIRGSGVTVAKNYTDCEDFKEFPSKAYFGALDIEHVSFDLNGKDGAIVFDLRTPLPEQFRGKFNIVTDVGTGEHINNQYMCFKNKHDLLKKGGISVNVLPLEGHWPGHCVYRYNESFFKEIANLCNYKILELKIQKVGTDKMVMCSLIKKDDKEFATVDDFNGLSIDVEDNSTTRDKNLYNYAYGNKKTD